MTTAQHFWGLLQRTVFDPASAVKDVIALDLPRSTLWQALVLATILSTFVVVALLGPQIDVPIGPDVEMVLTPFSYSVLQAAGLVLLIVAIHFTGTAMGGVGRIADTIAAVVWFEIVSIFFRLIQLVALQMSEGIAVIVGLASSVVLLWALVNFVNEIHQFNSRLKAGGTLILGTVGLLFGLSFIMAIIGAMTGLQLPSGG